MTGEILFIIRPLVYVLLMKKYGTRSWFPWCVSLAVDLIGNSILSVTLMPRHSGKNQQLQSSDSEKEEVRILQNFSNLLSPRKESKFTCTDPRLSS